MREPYETLLGQYRDHWLLWKYLEGDEPNWAAMADDPDLLMLSTGEWLMLHAAHAWRGDDTFRLKDLGKLDDDNRERIAKAIYLSMDRVR